MPPLRGVGRRIVQGDYCCSRSGRIPFIGAPWPAKPSSAFKVSLFARTKGPNESGNGFSRLSGWQPGISLAVYSSSSGTMAFPGRSPSGYPYICLGTATSLGGPQGGADAASSARDAAGRSPRMPPGNRIRVNSTSFIGDSKAPAGYERHHDLAN
jgi:hypothetical protein